MVRFRVGGLWLLVLSCCFFVGCQQKTIAPTSSNELLSFFRKNGHLNTLILEADARHTLYLELHSGLSAARDSVLSLTGQHMENFHYQYVRGDWNLKSGALFLSFYPSEQSKYKIGGMKLYPNSAQAGLWSGLHTAYQQEKQCSFRWLGSTNQDSLYFWEASLKKLQVQCPNAKQEQWAPGFFYCLDAWGNDTEYYQMPHSQPPLLLVLQRAANNSSLKTYRYQNDEWTLSSDANNLPINFPNVDNRRTYLLTRYICYMDTKAKYTLAWHWENNQWAATPDTVN